MENEKINFRPLRADEVDCRVSVCKEGGLSLLLYKDARCDMNILDETVGPERWQRHHSRDNANCTVSIYIPWMDSWVEKEDTGTESNTEAEKGLASDSFKRACFNWGIGRELYTAPFIWITSAKCAIGTGKNGKPACWDRFRVSEMSVENGKITSLAIVNESRNGEEVFRLRNAVQDAQRAPEEKKARESNEGVKTPESAAQEHVRASVTIGPEQVVILETSAAAVNINIPALLKQYGVSKCDELTADQYCEILERIDRFKKKAKGARRAS